MKRVIALVLCILLFTGCSSKNTASFYYPRSEFQYNTDTNVIGSEIREITGHTSHLSFLISLYLMGPHSTEFASPFMGSAKLLSVEKSNESITIHIPDMTQSITDAAFVLDCSCLAMTCFELTNVSSVTIVSGGKSITLTPELLTLYDTVAQTQ